MHLSHRSRFLTAILSLCALLFAQTALARYACPVAATASPAASTTEHPASAVVRAALPCAEAMPALLDAEQPGLCHAHCQDEQRSADHAQIPVLASLIELGAVLTLAPPAPPDRGLMLQPSLLQRTTAPPLAVRHCCFRT